jgi:hypothetical protein
MAARQRVSPRSRRPQLSKSQRYTIDASVFVNAFNPQFTTMRVSRDDEQRTSGAAVAPRQTPAEGDDPVSLSAGLRSAH